MPNDPAADPRCRTRPEEQRDPNRATGEDCDRQAKPEPPQYTPDPWELVHHGVGNNPAEEVQVARRERRKFSDDYKAEVVALVRSSGKAIGEISRDLDLTETAVRERVQRADVDGGTRNGLTWGPSTTASASTRQSATSVRQTTNPPTPLCVRPNKRVRQTGAGPLGQIGQCTPLSDRVTHVPVTAGKTQTSSSRLSHDLPHGVGRRVLGRSDFARRLFEMAHPL
jgi:transposase-like protein